VDFKRAAGCEAGAALEADSGVRRAVSAAWADVQRGGAMHAALRDRLGELHRPPGPGAGHGSWVRPERPGSDPRALRVHRRPAGIGAPLQGALVKLVAGRRGGEEIRSRAHMVTPGNMAPKD